MRKPLMMLLSLFAICSTTSAQSVTQTFDSDWQLNDPPIEITFESFDTMNGTRELTAVSLGFKGLLEMEVLVQNYTTLDLESNDWYYDAAANVMVSFSEKVGYENGGPFWGLGGIFVQDITGILSAGSGGTPFDNPSPGEIDVTATASNEIDTLVTGDANLDYYISDQPLEAKMAPFLDLVLTPPLDAPDGFVGASVFQLSQTGTLTLNYEYVPTLGRPEDCNGDGVVDLADLSCVCDEPHAALDDVLSALGLVHSDIDGDGEVAFGDFLILADQFDNAGNYTNGDLDCNGTVEFGDFLLLAANFGNKSAGTLVSVPEPSAQALFFACLIMPFARRKGRGSKTGE